MAKTVLSIASISSWNLHKDSKSWRLFAGPVLQVENTEAQRYWITCPRSHSLSRPKPIRFTNKANVGAMACAGWQI